MINIISNGSKFAGEEPDTIEDLIWVLSEHDLDIASYGTLGFVNFLKLGDMEVRILGNFLGVSHVFNIMGTYEELRDVINAISDNIKRQCNRMVQ